MAESKLQLVQPNPHESNKCRDNGMVFKSKPTSHHDKKHTWELQTQGR